MRLILVTAALIGYVVLFRIIRALHHRRTTPEPIASWVAGTQSAMFVGLGVGVGWKHSEENLALSLLILVGFLVFGVVLPWVFAQAHDLNTKSGQEEKTVKIKED